MRCEDRRKTAGRRFSGKAGKFERSAAGKVRKQRVQCEDRRKTAGRRFSGKAGKFERSGAGKVRKQRVQCEDRRKTAGIISLSVSANVLKS